MQIGDSLKRSIQARRCWTDTGVPLTAGHHYTFRVEGQWKDWMLPATDAAGFESPNFYMRLFEGRRPAPDRPWMALIGTLDRRKDLVFHIGTGTRDGETYSPPADGALTCCANDVIFFNNRGQVELTVTRVR